MSYALDRYRGDGRSRNSQWNERESAGAAVFLVARGIQARRPRQEVHARSCSTPPRAFYNRMSALPPPGSKVTIQGLVSKPELNGKVGTVLGPDFNEQAKAGYEKGRVPVQLTGGESGPPLLLKPESLTLEAGASSETEYEKLCDKGWSLFEKRQPTKAIDVFKEAIAMSPRAFAAHFQLAQVYESESGSDDLPGAAELAAMSYVVATELSSPESAAPDFVGWTAAFVRAANLLTGLPSAHKPPWWTSTGLKQRCGVVLSNPQGFLPDSSLVAPAWTIMAHAFLMENNAEEAASCYEKAAGYEMDGEKCKQLLERASQLNGGKAV